MLQTLWIVRHGQSAGNVARDLAEEGGNAMIDIADRDMDVPLSDLGRRQAQALGRWFGGLSADERPHAIYFSPYLRARQTAEAIAESLANPAGNPAGNPAVNLAAPRAGTAGPSAGAIFWRSDERLREKEFGILDRLTNRGIREQHPALSAQRTHVGKFYFRPPGGESWCDVILRLRSVLDMLVRDHEGERVLIVAHQVIVHCLRYLIEGLDEDAILRIDRRGDVPNCGVTAYERADRTDGADRADRADHPDHPDPGKRASMRLVLQNFAAPLEAAGAPVTTAPDAPAAAKS